VLNAHSVPETRLQEGQYADTVPVIMDRCHQSRVKNALEPEWEARFEPRSYGFRPGRGCHDAIAAIYNTCKGPQAKRVWALDADLAAALDVCSYCFLPDCHGWNRAC
jgi:retron-type reverse transcriptase